MRAGCSLLLRWKSVKLTNTSNSLKPRYDTEALTVMVLNDLALYTQRQKAKSLGIPSSNFCWTEIQVRKWEHLDLRHLNVRFDRKLSLIYVFENRSNQ